VTIQLDREVDVSRGCVLTKGTAPRVTNYLTASILYMDDVELVNDKNFFVKIGTKLIPGAVSAIRYKVDVNTGEKKDTDRLQKNEIAVCDIVLADQIVVDEFEKHKTLGELILIDRVTNMTSACGVITEAHPPKENAIEEITPAVRARQKDQTPYVVEADSLEEAKETERKLFLLGKHTMLLEGLTKEQEAVAEKVLLDAGLVVIKVK
jgi:sulfate adenylyltransferase subunit 1